MTEAKSAQPVELVVAAQIYLPEGVSNKRELQLQVYRKDCNGEIDVEVISHDDLLRYLNRHEKSAQPQLPPRSRQIVLSEIEGTGLTEAFVSSALDCAGHAIIRDSIMLGIAERIAERLAKAEVENESLKAAKPLRMFVWDGRGAYKISVCAGSVADARELALAEITFRGMFEIEGSPMFRAKAHVMQEQPHIYLRPNAELVLSENGETEELNICLESECSKRKTAESQLAALKTERDKAVEVVREYREFHLLTIHCIDRTNDEDYDARCPTCKRADEALGGK